MLATYQEYWYLMRGAWKLYTCTHATLYTWSNRAHMIIGVWGSCSSPKTLEDRICWNEMNLFNDIPKENWVLSAWVSIHGDTGGEKGFKGTQWVPTNRNAFSVGVLFKKCVCLISPFQELCNKIFSLTFIQRSHGRASAGQGSLEKGTQREVKMVLWPAWGLWLSFFVLVLKQIGLELIDICMLG